MSHGSSEKMEPNLVPLLDLVLQVVMFFMMTANLVMEEVNEAIKLPVAQAAKPIDRDEKSLIYLNVDDKGHTHVVGKDPFDTESKLMTYLRNEARDAKAKGGGEIKTLIVIRAHKDADFDRVYTVMKTAKTAGFTRIQLRAIQTGLPPAGA